MTVGFRSRRLWRPVDGTVVFLTWHRNRQCLVRDFFLVNNSLQAEHRYSVGVVSFMLEVAGGGRLAGGFGLLYLLF